MWSKPRDSFNEEALLIKAEPALEEALIMHVEAPALIAHITCDRAPLNAIRFTAPKDYAHAIDAPPTFVSGSKLVVKNTTCWVFKIKFKNSECE